MNRFLTLILASLCLRANGDLQVIWEQPIKGNSAFSTAIGDIDGDGDRDACVAYQSDAGHVFLNDGSGHFAPSPTAADLPDAGAVELGDLDGDGDLDLFLARHLAPSEIWLNDGAGNFSNSGQSIGGFVSRRALALADLDHDGDLDAVVPANSSSHPSEIWLNNGSGVFSNSGQSLGSQATQGCKVIDVNGDTHPDVALANNGANTLWLNNGSAVFTLSPTSLGSGNSFDISFANFDGDSDLDAFVANGGTSSNANEVWINNGSGTFSNSGQSLGASYSFRAALTDVDGDGDTDAVVGNIAGEPNQVWRNDGTGVFTLLGSTLGNGEALDIDIADLDGDGDHDYFLTMNGYPHEVWKRVPVNQGGPIADTGQRLGGGAASCVAAIDFDGDGDKDIAMGTGGGMVLLLRNNGAGQFSEFGTLPHPGSSTNEGIGVGDFNGDTFPDLLVVNSPEAPDRLWLNDGSGQFTATPQMIGTSRSSAVAVLDIDGDTDLDAVVGNRGLFDAPAQNTIYRNNGSGNFNVINAIGTESTTAIATGNLNGDNLPDIVVGNFYSPSTIWFNNGSNAFIQGSQTFGTGNTADIELADVDGDTDLDILQLNVNAATKLWLNDGTGTFSASPQVFTGTLGTGTAFFDHDGDGDMDIWLGQGFSGSHADELWLNDGAASFTKAAFTIRPQSTKGVVAADFDGNGSIDIFAASLEGDHILWSKSAATTVEEYCASFGLNGNDRLPDEDPDGDGVLNFQEMAFNMNPNSADYRVITNLANDTYGLPSISISPAGNAYRIEARTIRRIGSGLFRYEMQRSTDLNFATITSGVSINTYPLNANYERAVYRFFVGPGLPREFGRFKVSYEP